MFSWLFGKKQVATDAVSISFEKMQNEMRPCVEKLRTELGDEAMIKGMQLLDRVSILETVKLPFFQGLMELTFDVSDQVIDLYEPLGDFNALEVHGVCACIITTAISVINIPDDEKPFAMDIYLDLWVDTIVRNGQNINGPSLKDRIATAWIEYRPLIYHAEVEPVQYITFKPTESAARRLVSNVDRLAGVTRSDVEQQIVALRFKSAISEAVRITDELAFRPEL